MRLDLKADGTGNWSDVGRRGVALPFAPKDVLLNSVSISGGKVEITKQGVPQLTLDDVSGEANAQSLSGPYKVSANYNFEGRPQELRFSTSAPDAAGLFRIKSSLRDLDRNTTYLLDGGVTGLGAQPAYDGTILMRAANVAADSGDEATTDADKDNPPAGWRAGDKSLLYELKGPLKATPDRAEFPDFDLTIHAKGHPQIFKGKLTFDFGDRDHCQWRADGGLRRSRCFVRAAWAPSSSRRPPPSSICSPTKILGESGRDPRRHAPSRHRAGEPWRRSRRCRRHDACRQGRRADDRAA